MIGGGPCACCYLEERTSPSRHGFHTDSQKNSPCSPCCYPLRHYSFPCRMPVYRRSASLLRHSSRREIPCPQLYVPRRLPARRDSAAWSAAGARPAAGTIAGVMGFVCPQNAANRCCESWTEPLPARSPISWHAWAPQADCRSSCEQNLTARAWLLQPSSDLHRSVPHPPLRRLVRCADR
jgi:hypothetical protein